MSIDLSALRGREVTGRRAFTVERRHTTNVFGEQDEPPGRSAAADADPAESVAVLGSHYLLAVCEFTGRESLRGRLPEGTGTLGESAELSHRRAAPLGVDLLVETTLDRVATPRLELTGIVRRAEDRSSGSSAETAAERGRRAGEIVGTVGMTFRVVDRERFRRSLDR